MRKIRNHKLICFILAITIVISGVCLSEIQANSYFSCKQESSISTPDSSIRNVSAYRTERLSQREVVSTIRQVRNLTRRANSRTEFRIDICLSVVDILPQNSQYFAALEESFHYETLCFAAILNYIHEQDGEKV